MVTSINGLQQISKLYEDKSAKAIKKTEKVGKTDELTVSFKSQMIQKASAYLDTISDVREDRVAELKQAITAGNYDVSGEEIVSKIQSSLDIRG